MKPFLRLFPPLIPIIGSGVMINGTSNTYKILITKKPNDNIKLLFFKVGGTPISVLDLLKSGNVVGGL